MAGVFRPAKSQAATLLAAGVLGLSCVSLVLATGCGKDARDESGGDGAVLADADGGVGDISGNDEVASFDPESDGSDDGEGGMISGCVNPDGSTDDDGDSYDFSVIWIANTADGTVSKVDTRKRVEMARYRTGPTMDASPSRTSVSLRGDVAIANRKDGTVVKIAARVDDCVDTNGDGMIQTSQGATDVLAWGQDECVLWTHDLGLQFPGEFSEGGPRALAWEPGGDDPEDPCALRARLWVGWRGWESPQSPGMVRRIEADGTLDVEVKIDGWNGGEWKHGLYGGAADFAGNFWGIGSEGVLVRVDAESLEVDQWVRPGTTPTRRFYGIALDGQGNPWLATYDEFGVVKFDAKRGRFEEVGPAPVPNAQAGSTIFRGLVVDREYQVWVAGNEPCGLARYDITNARWDTAYDTLPGCIEPVGVSVDYDRFVWVVDRMANLAYKVNPKDRQAQTVAGFNTPYTYSDMTGSGLKLVKDQVDPPAR